MERMAVKQQTPEDISKLFNDKKNCNIAILTGIISRIIVFDIDGDEAEKHFDTLVESLCDTEIENVIKNTMQTKSGSGQGKHVVLRFNPKDFQNGQEIKTTTLWIGEGKHNEIKLKAEGGYILVLPSLHASGNRYEFINKVEPCILTKQRILKLVHAFNTKDYGECENNNNDDNNNAAKENKYTTYNNLTDEKIEHVVIKLKDYYYEGQRDEITFGLAGLLFKLKIALSSAKKIVTILCDSTGDEQKGSRIEVVNSTYLKGLNGEEIIGSTYLVEVFAKIISNNNNISANKVVKDIVQVLNEDNKQNGETYNKNNNNSDLTLPQLLIKLATENTSLFFKDQYDKAYAKVGIKDHSEIINLEGNKFKYFLSKLYYENSNGKVASQEAINDAIRLLQAETLFEDNNTIPLNLRVALKDDAFYYDMTDDNPNNDVSVCSKLDAFISLVNRNQ